MLTTLVKEPFDQPGWLFEIKWDGYRAIAEIDHRNVRLYSRHDLDLTGRYAEIVRSLKKLKRKMVLDGEVVVLDRQGRSSFQLLQNYQHTHQGPLVYYVFDLLELDGKNLRELPLIERKKLLKALLGEQKNVRFSDHVEGKGKSFFAAAKKAGLEGIIAKRADSPYRDGVRGKVWLKIKTHLQQEVVIAGFTEPLQARKYFGALVGGVYAGKKLRYVGHVGGGFNQESLKETYQKLKPFIQTQSPFSSNIKTNTPVTWVKPVVVAQVEFSMWTDEGLMRQPIFLGLREDTPAPEVIQEKAKAVQPKLQDPSESKKQFTHLEKVYWPKEGFTKGDVINYYREMAPFILPYLRNRPESLNRHPHGIAGESFFQKDVSNIYLPKWVKTVKIKSESEQRTIQYMLCQNKQTLLYMANLGCIEINPWDSTKHKLDYPDYLVMDLDPEGVPFTTVVHVAQELHRLFDRLQVPNYCKTSGGKGLHVYVPLGARYTYKQTREFAEIIATMVQKKLPRLVSVVHKPSKRKGKVNVDIWQNKFGATTVAVYSLRPRPGACVSTPLKWSEVKKGLDPKDFTIETVPERVKRLGDVFAGVLGKGINLNTVLSRAQKLTGQPSKKTKRS